MSFFEGGWNCTYNSWIDPQPVVTLASTNEVGYQWSRIPVGSYPTAIKAYRHETTTEQYGDGYSYLETITTTQPTRAIVTNLAGNTVSFVDLVNHYTITSIWVGYKPTSVAINAAETKAYVSAYDSGTISEIDLQSMSLLRTVYVGSKLSSVAWDASSNSLWAGGNGFVTKLNGDSLLPVQTLSSGGEVTSLAVSPQQSSVVFTRIAGPTFSAQQIRTSDSSTAGSYAAEWVGENQAPPGGGGGAPNHLLAPGSLVSVNYGNSIAVSATPSGFVVMDLASRLEIMRGTTPSPVKAIAVNPSQGIAYLTAPGSNSLITVPLPRATP